MESFSSNPFLTEEPSKTFGSAASVAPRVGNSVFGVEIPDTITVRQYLFSKFNHKGFLDPEIRVRNVKAWPSGKGYEVDITLSERGKVEKLRGTRSKWLDKAKNEWVDIVKIRTNSIIGTRKIVFEDDEPSDESKSRASVMTDRAKELTGQYARVNDKLTRVADKMRKVAERLESERTIVDIVDTDPSEK